MKYTFIGWCKEDNHDKVWGVIDLGSYKYITFWGRRGKKLQTKTWERSSYELSKLTREKERKGYISVSKENLDKVYPEFEQDLEKTAIWSMLTEVA